MATTIINDLGRRKTRNQKKFSHKHYACNLCPGSSASGDGSVQEKMLLCKHFYSYISIHKSQGMTIGPGEVFEKVVVYLPEDQREQSPGLELVAFSRAKGPDCLAVGNNSNNLTIMSI